MYTTLSLLSIAVLLCIAVQDFRQRAIYWWLCPLLMLVLAAKSYFFSTNSSYMLLSWLVNIVIITVQLSVVCLYVQYRKRSTGRSLRSSIGLGDVLFLYAACFALPPLPFVALCCAGFIVALVAKLLMPSKFANIPLAGWLACLLLVVSVIEVVAGKQLWKLMPTV